MASRHVERPEQSDRTSGRGDGAGRGWVAGALCCRPDPAPRTVQTAPSQASERATPFQSASALPSAAVEPAAAPDPQPMPASSAKEDPIPPFVADEWEVRRGAWHFEPNGELSCEAKNAAALIFRKGAVVRDVEMSVEVMFFRCESSAGLIFRSDDKDYQAMSFYQFEWYTKGTHHDKRLSLMTKNPAWNQIVEPTTPEAPYNKWIELKVRAQGEELRTWVDGVEAFAKRDRTLLREGESGCMSGSQSR